MRAAAFLLVVALAACSTAAPSDEEVTLRLLTHESFNVSEDVLAAFTEETGITVEPIATGDAGAVVNQAILTVDDPQGDVLFGVDSTFLTRALDADLFVAYEAAGLEDVPERYRLDPEHRVTPVDFGDVCLNYDVAAFEERGLAVPGDLADLTDPAYAGTLVVQNPATSSPGLAFLLATVARFGEDGWLDYWAGAARQRRAGGRRLVGGLLRRVLRDRRRRAPAGGVLRVQPAGRGRVRRPADRGAADRRGRGVVLPAGGVRRDPRRARRTRPRRASCSTSCSPTRSRRTCR